MKATKLFLIGLLALPLSAFVAGCGDDDDPPETKDSDTQDSETESEGGDPDGGTGDTDVEIDISECAEEPDNTCAAKIEAGYGEDCVADFGYKTTQAGYKDNYDLGYVGFYGYNDVTDGATMTPKPNYNGSEAAEKIVSCDINNDYALHFVAEGYSGWGAGVGLNWGGPNNDNCDVEGASDCLQLRIDDDHYALADAVADETACGGENADAKIHCFKYGKNVHEPKDLSADPGYVGIGFWLLSTDKNESAALKVTFPIPATMRFYGELYDDEFGYEGKGCDEDDDDADNANGCFNDFYTTVALEVAPLNPSAEDNTNKWIYHEVLFDDLAISQWFGLDLGKHLGMESFPREQSMGIKFQVDANSSSPISRADFYIDDVILLR